MPLLCCTLLCSTVCCTHEPCCSAQKRCSSYMWWSMLYSLHWSLHCWVLCVNHTALCGKSTPVEKPVIQAQVGVIWNFSHAGMEWFIVAFPDGILLCWGIKFFIHMEKVCRIRIVYVHVSAWHGILEMTLALCLKSRPVVSHTKLSSVITNLEYPLIISNAWGRWNAREYGVKHQSTK